MTNRSSILFVCLAIMNMSSSLANDKGWKHLIEGENLALGRSVLFAPRPLHSLTTTGMEAAKLTDGKWTDENLSHSKHAVGWAYFSSPVHMIVDLGDIKPVGSVVARFLGGKGWVSTLFPRVVQISLSEDGIHYYTARKLTKVNAGERELAENQPHFFYYLPEEGKDYVHPFVIPINRKARYVALNITPGTHSLFTDEIWILASRKPETAQSLEGLPPYQFISKGVEVRPKTEELVITRNVVTPNYFSVIDVRADREKPVRLQMDLPKGISIRAGWKGKVERDPDEFLNRWYVTGLWDSQKPDWQGMEGPLYFILKPDAPDPEGGIIRISSDDPDSLKHVTESKIRTVNVPEVPRLRHTDVSLAWMSEKDHAFIYPEFFPSFRHLGFNAIGTFPRNFTDASAREQLKNFANEIRKHEMKVLYNESPIHVMEQARKTENEIYNQIGGEKGKHISPVYTGQYYREEMQRIRQSAQLIHPDIVLSDIELWHEGVSEAWESESFRQAAQEAKAINRKRFMLQQGERLMRDLWEAVRGSRVDGGNPVVGSYNVSAQPPVYHDIFDFRKLYPESIQYAMPVLYLRGDVRRVHEIMRENYLAVRKRIFMPWMSAGTYGEYPPHLLEQQILEVLLNGGCGIAYYRFQDHDPMDYYHQAMALFLIAPYEDMIAEGRLLDAETNNANITISLWGNDKEALLLVGNYSSKNKEQTEISFLGKQPVSFLDVKTQQPLRSSEKLGLTISGGAQHLIYVRFKE